MGFIQEFESFAILFGGPNGCSKGCVHYLGTQLFYVFMFKLIGGNVLELTSSKLKNTYYKCCGRTQVPSPLSMMKDMNKGKYEEIDEDDHIGLWLPEGGSVIKNPKNIALDFCEQNMYTIEDRLLTSPITNIRSFGSAFTSLKMRSSLSKRKTAAALFPSKGMNEIDTIKKSNMFHEL